MWIITCGSLGGEGGLRQALKKGIRCGQRNSARIEIHFQTRAPAVIRFVVDCEEPTRDTDVWGTRRINSERYLETEESEAGAEREERTHPLQNAQKVGHPREFGLRV
jgi:hypothetical protein